MRSVTREFTITAGLNHCVELVILWPRNIEMDNYCLVNSAGHCNSQSRNADNFLVITKLLCLGSWVSCYPAGEVMRQSNEGAVVGAYVCFFYKQTHVMRREGRLI